MRFSTQSIIHDLMIKPENKKFYRKLSLEEAEQISSELLACLKVFDEICRDNNLTYFIVAGGLIGAIRTNSLLPWDDDVDLVMPRNDYKQFKNAFQNSKYLDQYCFKYPEDNDIITMGAHFFNFHHPLTDLIGEEIGNSNIYESFAYLDIVPLDSCCENPFLDRLKGALVNFIQMGYISRRCYEHNDPFVAFLSNQSFELRFNLFIRKLFAAPFLIIPKGILFKQLDLLLSYNDFSSNVTISYGALRYFGEKLPRSVFKPAKNYLISGLLIMIPSNPDYYLRHRYGDYMKEPSQEEKNSRMVRLRTDWKKYI